MPPSYRRAAAWLPLVLASFMPAAPAHAQAPAPAPCDAQRAVRPPSAGLRIDNDLIGGQDEGYTNGAVLSFVSPNLQDFTDDPCLPAAARWLNRGLTWLQPQQAEQRNMTFSLGQAIYTPRDNERRDLITEDRPYAALLVASFGYHGRRGDTLESTVLRLGWVGPSARGEEVQRAVHKITGSKRFEGWSNQLHDEPVFQLQREWTRRIGGNGEAPGSNRTWDSFVHGGAALGTLATGAVVGAQWRYGTRLPDDFGSLPAWAGGDGAAPVRTWRDDSRWSGHVFAGADLRWVAHNVTLDGNTFRHSHGVDRRALVGEIGYGFVLRQGAWKFSLARYHRTREFDGQHRRPVFGSFALSRDLSF